MQILIYLFMALSQFGLTELFGDIARFGGYPILAWVEYLLYVCSFGITFIYSIRINEKYKYKVFFFMFLMALSATYAVTAYHGGGIMDIMRASVNYALPILIFPAMAYAEMGRVKIINAVCLISMLAAVVTILFVLGLFDSTLSEKASGMERSSLIVDGGLGVVAFALSLHLIICEKQFDKFYKYGTMISGLIIVFGGQSRARIVLLFLVLFAFFFLHMFFSKGKQIKVFRLILTIAIIVGLAYVIFPAVSNLAEKILGRFETMGTDSSSMYRVFERNRQMEAFEKSWFFGVGWTGLEGVTVKDLYGQSNAINNHNMYSSVLAYGGLIYSVPFFLWIGFMIWNAVKNLMKNDRSKLHLVLIMILLVLGWSSAGFGKFSQLLSFMIIYADIIEEAHIPSPIKKRKEHKFVIKFW